GDEVDGGPGRADDRGRARELSTEFLDLVALVGTPDDAQGRLAELREMGVDLPVVRAPAGVDREWVARTLEVFAP
ncbi:LLM class flavin-dependent oxidoreductase, partial [Haloferax sp. AB510]|nr:LLM class flavin-dependent oxidoreductase [Haloferax sp. AB510]